MRGLDTFWIIIIITPNFFETYFVPASLLSCSCIISKYLGEPLTKVVMVIILSFLFLVEKIELREFE